MPHRTFAVFIFPSILAMVPFISLPIVSVPVQSFFAEHEALLLTVENCTPLGCETQTTVDTAAMESLRTEQPMGQFAGLSNYLNRNHLALAELREIMATAPWPSP